MLISENEQKCRDLRTKLESIYGYNIAFYIGSANWECKTNNIHDASIAIYMNYQEQIAVIWDLCRRRYCGVDTDSVSITKDNIKSALTSQDFVVEYYRKVCRACMSPYEKILIIGISALERIIIDNESLYVLLLFNKEDIRYPSELKNKQIGKDEEKWYVDKERTKSTVERINRYYKFREKVLRRYDFKCAICRCDEEKLLQAAHIKAVSNHGNDNPKNGICLCANHHLMFDRNLIKIDFTNSTLTYIDESVKKMAWYQEFINKYNGKVLNANDNDIIAI